MNQREITKTTISLLRCFLTGEPYEASLSDELCNEVYALAAKHDVAHLIAVVLAQSVYFLVKAWRRAKALNMDKTPKVIISASGMCDAGRIRHHLKHNIWRPESSVVFVGFQSPGTLGRHLLDGAESVKMFGEKLAVKAKIVNFQGLSSHGDHDHLVQWAKAVKPEETKHIFVVHGDADVVPLFVKDLENLGYSAHGPLYTEEYDLIANCRIKEGYLPEKEKAETAGGSKADNLFQRLVSAGDSLMSLIRRSKGRDNKSLARFAEQLRQLLEKWEA